LLDYGRSSAARENPQIYDTSQFLIMLRTDFSIPSIGLRLAAQIFKASATFWNIVGWPYRPHYVRCEGLIHADFRGIGMSLSRLWQ